MSTTPDPEFWGEERPARTRRDETRHRLVDRRPPGADGRWERLRDLWEVARGDPRTGLAVLVLVAVVAGVVWYRVGASGGAPAAPAEAAATPTTADRRSSPPAGPADPTAASSANAASGADSLIVHVAGAVQHPGVVELPSGSRVIDAVEAAGGGLAEADLDRLNLAAKLADGERVLVQRVGDPPAVPAAPGTSSDVPDDAVPGLLNLNTATPAQLEELPGIGPVLAAAIVTERDRRGGFRSVNELRDVRGIGEQRFADLAELVIV